MENTNIENPDSQNVGGDGMPVVIPLTDQQIANLSSEERIARMEQQFSSFEVKNRELYARTKKAEDRIKKMREAAEDEVVPVVVPKETTNNDTDRLDRIDLRLSGYDEDDVDYLMTLGGKEALKRKEIKDFMDYKRQKKQQESNTPTPQSRSVPALGKTPLKDLSYTEDGQKKLKDNFEQVVAKFKKGGGSQGGII